MYPWKYTLGLVVSVTISAGIAAGQDTKSDLPDAPGKESLQQVCSSCHDLDTVTATHRSKTAWQQTIDDMVDRGASGSDDDMAAILSYLTTFYGRVNVNTATVEEMQKSLDLSAKEARAIVAYREHNGKINNLDELKKIPGLDPDKLEAKRASIAFAP